VDLSPFGADLEGISRPEPAGFSPLNGGRKSARSCVSTGGYDVTLT
jgi:hypothetical protein